MHIQLILFEILFKIKASQKPRGVTHGVFLWKMSFRMRGFAG